MSKFCLRVSAVLLLLAVLCCCSCRKEDAQEQTPTPRRLTWAIGTELPQAKDFFLTLPEGATVAYDSSSLLSLHEGENSVKLVYRPQKGKEQILETVLCLIEDTQPPEIVGVGDLIAYLGEGISYRSGVSVHDNCDGDVTLQVDSSGVDPLTEGSYPVVYSATDHAGNTAVVSVELHIYLEKITLEQLYAEIDFYIDELGLRGMNREEQAKTVYSFVHTGAGITYVNTSDKTDWVRAAYFCLRDRQGDCFSFFSLSKGFFERLGIENMDIQRLPGYTADTHYWSLINIAAAGQAPEWYHYDATRVRDVYYSAALLTDRQVQAFSRMRANFYLYDATAYPSSATAEKIARPDLTSYYS